MSESSPKKKQISIPEDLYESIVKSIEGQGFSSVDDYITYVFRVIMGKKNATVQEITDDDEKKVMEQLKSLGYI